MKKVLFSLSVLLICGLLALQKAYSMSAFDEQFLQALKSSASEGIPFYENLGAKCKPSEFADIKVFGLKNGQCHFWFGFYDKAHTKPVSDCYMPMSAAKEFADGYLELYKTAKYQNKLTYKSPYNVESLKKYCK